MELPSVDALEEATAYAATVKAYDALIDKLERGQQYTLIMKSLTRMDWKVPMGPAGSAAEYAWTANFPLTVADGPEPHAVSGRTIRNFEGRLIGGQCQYTGMPMLIDTAIDGTLADGRFQLKFNQKGMTLPPFGVQCPRGAGMAGPAQMAPQGPSNIEVEAVDKAKWVYDYAKTPMAMMMAPVARVSGDATVEVEACTKDE